MVSKKSLSRRQFLTGAALGMGATVAVPIILPRNVFGANEEVVTGHIGLGGMGGNVNLRAHLQRAAALADVDKKHLAGAQKRRARVPRKCDAYGDFRKILDRKDVDAVVVSTPDHWHALPTILACQAGKDVYCEKPLTLTISEGRAIVRMARGYKRIVQTGAQWRSASACRRAVELVRNGHIGEVKRITVGIRGLGGRKPGPDQDPPEWLDYDFWLGPAPWRPYNPSRVHFRYRNFWDYAGGALTDWGSHYLDTVQWALDADSTGPVEISGTATFHPQRWYETPTTFICTYKYANGVTVTCGEGLPRGVTFIGDKGQIQVHLTHLATTPRDIARLKPQDGQFRLPKTRGHHGEWLDCIRTRKLPVCECESGHRSATVCHLGNIALRTRRKLRWDPVKEAIIGDADAMKYVNKPYRAPWALPEPWKLPLSFEF